MSTDIGFGIDAYTGGLGDMSCMRILVTVLVMLADYNMFSIDWVATPTTVPVCAGPKPG